jgi:hypothetical protein
MPKITKYLTIFIILFSLNSCLLIEPMPSDWDWGLKPRPLTGVKNFPSAKTEYGKGFRDGCYSAWNAVSKGLASDLDPRFDFKRHKKTSDYGIGWFDGIEQCTYILDWDVP